MGMNVKMLVIHCGIVQLAYRSIRAQFLLKLKASKLYGDVECAQQPRPTGDLGEIAGVNGQNSEGMCQGGKPGTGKLYTDVCLCCSAHTSGCVVDGLGATAAF